MAGTIIVDRIESDASYASTINVAGQITFSNTVNFGVFAGTAPVAGFYLPTTNNVAFTTASTERMRIDSSGNVGIGTASPVSQLHLAKTSDLVFTQSGYGISWGGADNGSPRIYGSSAGIGGVSGFLAFKASTGSEAMRIDASGNVGIGTSSPSTKLQVNGQTRISDGTTNIDIVCASTVGYIGTQTNAPLVLRTNDTERARIDTNGQIKVSSTFPVSMNALRGSGFGYAPGTYSALIVGSVAGSNSTVCIGVDPIANAGGSFGGGGQEVLFRNVTTFLTPNSGNTNYLSLLTLNNGNVQVTGALSKGSGSFRIEHPLPQLAPTHELVHSFIEGPQADLIYRGKVSLVSGIATVNIDAASTMTEGTFVALCRDVQCFTTNESDWTAVRGSVSGNILTIEAQDSASTASISWMVIGERQDKHMMDTSWTDENGKVIVEPLKEALENR